MDRLIGEHRDVPVYAENLYKWTPEPSVLKHDANWDAPTLEDLECPYCGPLPQKDIIQCGSGIVCIQNNKLMVITSDGYMDPTIIFCPMCGRQLS